MKKPRWTRDQFKRFKMCASKTKYASQLKARQTIANIRHRDKRAHLRSYRCHYCDGWHLTSKQA